MACAFCIARQKKLVAWFCKRNPNGRLCKRAQIRLAAMEAPQPEKKK